MDTLPPQVTRSRGTPVQRPPATVRISASLRRVSRLPGDTIASLVLVQPRRMVAGRPGLRNMAEEHAAERSAVAQRVPEMAEHDDEDREKQPVVDERRTGPEGVRPWVREGHDRAGAEHHE